MKRIVLGLIFLFTYFISFGQSYQKDRTYGVEYQRVKIDSAFFVPFKDTSSVSTVDSRPGIIILNKADSTLYLWNSHYWIPIVGKETDTTSLSNRINEKLNASDTTGHWAPAGIYIYPSDTSVFARDSELALKLNISDTTNKWAPKGNYLHPADSVNLSYRIDTVASHIGEGGEIDTTSLSNRIDQKLSRSDSTGSTGYVSRTALVDTVLAHQGSGGTDTTFGASAPITISRADNKITYGADTSNTAHGLATIPALNRVADSAKAANDSIRALKANQLSVLQPLYIKNDTAIALDTSRIPHNAATQYYADSLARKVAHDSLSNVASVNLGNSDLTQSGTIRKYNIGANYLSFYDSSWTAFSGGWVAGNLILGPQIVKLQSFPNYYESTHFNFNQINVDTNKIYLAATNNSADVFSLNIDTTGFRINDLIGSSGDIFKASNGNIYFPQLIAPTGDTLAVGLNDQGEVVTFARSSGGSGTDTAFAADNTLKISRSGNVITYKADTSKIATLVAVMDSIGNHSGSGSDSILEAIYPLIKEINGDTMKVSLDSNWVGADTTKITDDSAHFDNTNLFNSSGAITDAYRALNLAGGTFAMLDTTQSDPSNELLHISKDSVALGTNVYLPNINNNSNLDSALQVTLGHKLVSFNLLDRIKNVVNDSLNAYRSSPIIPTLDQVLNAGYSSSTGILVGGVQTQFVQIDNGTGDYENVTQLGTNASGTIIPISNPHNVTIVGDSDYTVTDSDKYIILSNPSVERTLTLPSSSAEGRELTIVCKASGADKWQTDATGFVASGLFGSPPYTPEQVSFESTQVYRLVWDNDSATWFQINN